MTKVLSLVLICFLAVAAKAQTTQGGCSVSLTGPTAVCANSIPAALTGSPQGGTYFPSNTINTQVAPGEYIYTYSVNGCPDVDTLTVEVLGLPAPNFTYSIIDCYTLCIIDSTLPSPAIFIDWADGSTSVATNCHIYPFNGIFCPIIQYTNACGTTDTSFCITINCTGIEEDDYHNIINISPNPATTNLTINTGNLQNSLVELFDVSGRKLLQEKVVNSLSTLDISSLNNGVYIAVITANNKVVKREKIILSR